MSNYKFIENGSVTSPLGFVAGGVIAGIKPNNTTKRDLGMIFCEKPCTAAAIFTKNRVKSDTIYVTQEHLKNGVAQAVIANSGNANACNPDGYEKAEQMCALAADALGIAADDVIVASTGVIGQALPIEPIEKSVGALKDSMTRDGGTYAAEAIMTTDTIKKEWAVQLTLGGKTVTIGGIAKGSGMIHINMGTTLSFVTTDAAVSAEMLHSALIEAADVSYNMVSVDGDTSTNDTLAIMASGLAGNDEITEKNGDYALFVEALTAAFKAVAKKLAADGEGATKLVIGKVSGAAAMFGADANCGRILCAIGYSGAEVDVKKIDVSYRSAKGEILVCKDGMGLAFDEDKAKEILIESEIDIIINLGDGNGEAEAYGCDLTYDYVKINGDYRT